MVKILTTVITLAALGWAVLFFSGKAVLINQSASTQSGGGLVQTYTCTYFDGLALHDLEETYSPLPLLKDATSQSCPRLVDMQDSVAY